MHSARTFDGRDVFAPAAAHLAIGVPLGDLGPTVPVGDLVRLPQPLVVTGPGVLDAEVLTIDRFGNLQLAATAAHLDAAGLAGARVVMHASGRSHDAIVGVTFADVPTGELVVYVDSAGQVALALNGGDAAATLRLKPGDMVRVVTLPP